MVGKRLNISLALVLSSVLVLPLLAVVVVVNAEPITEEKTALLDFINEFPHLINALNWNENTSVCTRWSGVRCNPGESHVIGVHLPSLGLIGQIPLYHLTRLSELQVLNLSSNQITGQFDLINLTNLSILDLHSNNFTGPLLILSTWKKLSVVDLSNNQFNGSIPSSISRMENVVSLNLANNSFTGKIPDLNLPNLRYLDLSFNKLIGLVPKSLIRRFPWSSFAGNHVLSSSLSSSDSLSLPTHPSSTSSQAIKPEMSNDNDKSGGKRWLLVIIVASSTIGLFSFTFLCLLTLCCTRRIRKEVHDTKFPNGDVKKKMKSSGGSDDDKNVGGRLVFFSGCSYAGFDLEDLLGASAEVLGKGTFGMSYKAILEDASVVVVKRLKEVCVGRKEFEMQMSLIGGIRHKNVVAVRGYYYSRDEKLIVGDHCMMPSVSDLLHDGRGEEGRVILDWETRLNIAVGAARGIAYIHQCNIGNNNNNKLVHGNIRSTNIFLTSMTTDDDRFGCVSDFGLAQIMSPVGFPVSRSLGHIAPEITDTRKPTHASDVYSFGVFLLELLTGKSPVVHVAGDGRGEDEEMVHLVRWAHAMVREEWTGEVFDYELVRGGGRCSGVEEEMVEMLRIGMGCVAMDADQRPVMVEVVRMIEVVRSSVSGSSDSARDS